MKNRTGFVSNSSSSSFVCCICDRKEVVFDGGLIDVEMMQCVNGHTICCEEAVETLPDPCDENEYYYMVEEKYCPVCQFLETSNIDMAAYLLKETKIPRDEVFVEVKNVNKRRKKLYDNEYVVYACQKSGIDGSTLLPTIKEKFKTYSEFKKYLRTI